MRYQQLGKSGSLVSQLGFGASPLGGVYGSIAEHDGAQAVHAALDAGIAFFDVAPYYGYTAAATVLGKALHGAGRDQYVLATKAGRPGDDAFDFTASGVTASPLAMGALTSRGAPPLAGLTRALANEWAPCGVNVNAIVPGYVATDNARALRDDATRNAAILDRIRAGRWAEPDDFAGVAAFLASRASDYVHGTLLPIDGGWLGR